MTSKLTDLAHAFFDESERVQKKAAAHEAHLGAELTRWQNEARALEKKLDALDCEYGYRAGVEMAAKFLEEHARGYRYQEEEEAYVLREKAAGLRRLQPPAWTPVNTRADKAERELERLREEYAKLSARLEEADRVEGALKQEERIRELEEQLEQRRIDHVASVDKLTEAAERIQVAYEQATAERKAALGELERSRKEGDRWHGRMLEAKDRTSALEKELEEVRQERNTLVAQAMQRRIVERSQPCGQPASVTPASTYERVIEGLQAELVRVRRRLPAMLQNSTIRFEECPVGHGALRPDNWVKGECQPCKSKELQRRLDDVSSAYNAASGERHGRDQEIKRLRIENTAEREAHEREQRRSQGLGLQLEQLRMASQRALRFIRTVRMEERPAIQGILAAALGEEP